MFVGEGRMGFQADPERAPSSGLKGKLLSFEYSNDAASRLIAFFKRLGNDVKEGSGYETKNIPDKVAKRIRSQDILVCVFTPGDSSWILSETSLAKALQKYIIILCDSRMDINKGIVGRDCARGTVVPFS
jgi:hypothetical protein